MFELGAVLHGQAQVRNCSSTWIGLDLMEITGLALTALTVWAGRNASVAQAAERRDR